MTIKESIINAIIDREAGYVNDPNDSGGETNHGITIKVARDNGYNGAMVNLARSTAFSIYENSFWNKLLLDEILDLSEIIAHEIADTAVNMGKSRASKFLQRSLNVLNNKGSYYRDLKVDGDIGNKTLINLKTFLNKRGDAGEDVLNKMLNCLQGAFYVQLAERREKDESFIFGWFKNRVN